ncbi:hypothetical protein HMPREF1982_03181 [Clostridiales bacterium oral taxon 876 str. F0540]|nr:hypothetical protein HMPREF1982_03181 [Clostridiales bacterium oral taxon 876 str. F0540]
MKIKALVLAVAVGATLFTGCAKKAEPAAAPKADAAKPAATETKKTDAVATASVVDTNAAFEKALTKDGGKYVIATLKDLTFDKELVVEGSFKTGKKDANGALIKDANGNEQTQRKIGLYTQDDKHNVTGRFTLTAPKLTFNGDFGSLEHGTFKGDLYIAGKNFKLVNQKIDGNVYFLNADAEKTFTIADSKTDSQATVITGKKELKK